MPTAIYREGVLRPKLAHGTATLIVEKSAAALIGVKAAAECEGLL